MIRIDLPLAIGHDGRMKPGKIHSVAHNFTDSIAGGLSFVVPGQVLGASVWAEVQANGGNDLIVDFLKGTVSGAVPGGDLDHAVATMAPTFPVFCDRHGVDSSDVWAFVVRFFVRSGAQGYVITVEDQNGRRTSREYLGHPGARSKAPDRLGRLRPRILPSPAD